MEYRIGMGVERVIVVDMIEWEIILMIWWSERYLGKLLCWRDKYVMDYDSWDWL